MLIFSSYKAHFRCYFMVKNEINKKKKQDFTRRIKENGINSPSFHFLGDLCEVAKGESLLKFFGYFRRRSGLK